MLAWWKQNHQETEVADGDRACLPCSSAEEWIRYRWTSRDESSRNVKSIPTSRPVTSLPQCLKHPVSVLVVITKSDLKICGSIHYYQKSLRLVSTRLWDLWGKPVPTVMGCRGSLSLSLEKFSGLKRMARGWQFKTKFNQAAYLCPNGLTS